MMKFIKRFYLSVILFFLYVPIVVLIVQSFNAGKSRLVTEQLRECGIHLGYDRIFPFV